VSALLPLLFALGSPASAEEVRVGVFVGNNAGSGTDQELVFAASDARKMRDLLVQYGQIEAGDAVLLENQPRKGLVDALQGLHRRLVDARNAGDHSTLFFYYSGHGDGDALHLGSSQVPHDELRALLEDTGADVRIAMLDACQSGGVVRAKGGTRGPSHSFAVEASQARGTVFLTSSAASELSQESAEVGGGFFTHYLHSALLGAGDANRDGEVSLTEAYSYVHGETVFGTHSSERAQTPTFDFDLVGAGNIAVTTLEAATSRLNFLGDLGGTYAIWDDSRRRYVAEIDGARPLQIAVRPGDYYVHKRMPGWVDEAKYPVRRGETRTIAVEDFVSVPYEQTASRGHLERVVRRSRLPDLSLRARLGIRTFGEASVVGSQYVPQHGVLGVEARFQDGASITYASVDLLAGGGPGTLKFPERGEVPVIIQSYSAAGAFGFVTPPGLFRAGFGGRAELVGFTRTFTDGATDPQSSLTLAPGVQGWVGLHHGRFSLELQHDVMLMALAFTEDRRHPIYSNFLLASGVRF
jgi:hypothetical protein